MLGSHQFCSTSQLHWPCWRPRFIIPREQLQHLIEAYLSVSHIDRRRTEYGLYIRDTFSDITYSELGGFISDIHQEFHMCGNRQMTGHLQAHGFRIQQHRIRNLCVELTQRELLHTRFILFIVVSMLLLLLDHCTT